MTQTVHPSPNVATARVRSTTLTGLEADHVRIEVKVSPGGPTFQLLGPFSETGQRETRVRVVSALKAMGITLHRYEVVVDVIGRSGLSPTATADLPIALAILVALGKVPATALDDVAVVGELSLTGDVRPVRGALAHVLGAKLLRFGRVILPEANSMEAGAASGITVHVASSLRQVVDYLNGSLALDTANSNPPPPHTGAVNVENDFSQIIGFHFARRALEIAATGGHNLLLCGPPGAGKTMLARRLPSILPPLTDEEAITVTMIRSIAGLLAPNASITYSRPFRAPHHSVSEAGLLGSAGPTGFHPGELSLAHFGVLYLDAIMEFRGSVLDAVPMVLERGDLTFHRGPARGTFPARPLVIASAPACPAEHRQTCECQPERLAAYRTRLTSRTARTFELRVPTAVTDSAATDGKPESSATIRERVIAARMLRAERASGRFNSLSASLDSESARLISEATARLQLSGSDYSKILRVARTIADLDGSTVIRSHHAAEAINVTNVSFAQT